MRSSRRILLAGALPGLALAALASSPAVAESEAEAHKRLKLQQPRLTGEWAPKPVHQPKKGKPTKAEKKAAKRARTRGVGACPLGCTATENCAAIRDGCGSECVAKPFQLRTDGVVVPDVETFRTDTPTDESKAKD